MKRRRKAPQGNENTKICSRHFREGDIKKCLAGKNELRNEVVPSVFPWIRTSPRKRKSHKVHHGNRLQPLLL